MEDELAADKEWCLGQVQSPWTPEGPVAVPLDRKIDCTVPSYQKKSQRRLQMLSQDNNGEWNSGKCLCFAYSHCADPHPHQYRVSNLHVLPIWERSRLSHWDRGDAKMEKAKRHIRCPHPSPACKERQNESSQIRISCGSARCAMWISEFSWCCFWLSFWRVVFFVWRFCTTHLFMCNFWVMWVVWIVLPVRIWYHYSL